MDKDLAQIIENMEKDLWALAHTIHSYHEIKFEEYRSADALCHWLEAQDFEVEKPVGGLETAFVASRTLGTGGPTLAFLAEYDALPEIGHACGHNLIATMSAGAGVALGRWLQQHNVPGHIAIIGCPAEEGGGGKISLLEAGVFEGVDAALMLHPAAFDEVRPEYLAREGIDIEFVGRAAHAAAAPQYGFNALDAVVTFYQMVNSLRQRLFAQERLHGIITHGGDSPNVIPEHTSARFLVRSDRNDRVETLLADVVTAAQSAADGTGCQMSWRRFVPRYETMRHSPVLSRVADDIYPLWERTPNAVAQPHGSTDMGNVSRFMPSLHANIGLGKDLVAHTREFCTAADSHAGFEAMRDGAGILAGIGARLADNPQLVEEAWVAWNEETQQGGDQ